MGGKDGRRRREACLGEDFFLLEFAELGGCSFEVESGLV